MIVSNRVIANIIVFSYGMICLFGQDLFNFVPMFSEDYYRGELLKIDYDICVDYYDIKKIIRMQTRAKLMRRLYKDSFYRDQPMLFPASK